MSILEDIAIIPQHRLLTSILNNSSSSYKQAIILAKTWLTQRELRWKIECIDGHLIAMLIAYLIQSKRVQTTSTPFSIFQTMIQFVCDTDLLDLNKVLTFQSNNMNCDENK